MTDKQIIDEERMFKCVWCKYDFKESNAHFILSANPNECVCRDCMTEWADNLLCDFIRKEQECKELRKQNKKLKHSFKELNAYIEKAQEWLKKQKSNDIFIDEMKAILLEELKCLKKK